MSDLFDRLQDISDRVDKLRANEQRRETKLNRELEAMEIDLLLADMSSLLRHATVPRSREQQKAGIQKRIAERIGRAA